MTTQQQHDDRLLELLYQVRTIMEEMSDVYHKFALRTQSQSATTTTQKKTQMKGEDKVKSSRV
jgi:hypothetical protein